MKIHCALNIDSHQQQPKMKEQMKILSQSYNTMTQTELKEYQNSPNQIVKINNHDIISQQLNKRLNRMNKIQLVSYNDFFQTIEDGIQCIEFISGEGGTGKSEVCLAIIEKSKLLFGKTEGINGPVITTAPTGNSAHNIGGSTWQSIFKKHTTSSRITSKIGMKPDKIVALQKEGKGAKVLIIEEVSLQSLEDLYEIDHSARYMMNVHDKPFGGLHVLLLGDFYQMKTMGGTAIVEELTANSSVEAKEAKKIFTEYLTHFFELTENCRAASNNGTLSPLAAFNRAARLATLTPSLVAIMNTRVVNDEYDAMIKSDPKACWITSLHSKITNINNKIKVEMKKQGKIFVRIIANHIPANTQVAIPNMEQRDQCYSVTGCNKGSRDKPLMTHLDLAIGSRVRCIRNLAVEIGIYNGAMGTVYGFVYQGDQYILDTDTKRFSEYEDHEREIPIVLVQMDGDDDDENAYSCNKNIPRLVPFVPITGEARVKNQYLRQQLPLLLAHARTSHTLQGLSANDGVVLDPGSMFFAGDYIGCSRATDINKLFLLSPISEKNFSSHPEYRMKVNKFYTFLRDKFNNKSLMALLPDIKQICN
jgi:hypothetical protein